MKTLTEITKQFWEEMRRRIEMQDEVTIDFDDKLMSLEESGYKAEKTDNNIYNIKEKEVQI